MLKITDLLHEVQYLFPTKSVEMKGILGELGEMKTPLNPDAKLVKQRPYKLNLQYKERAKSELKCMMDVGIIELVEELGWISSMVVQDRKTMEIRICVNLRKLKKVSIHDLFPTSFTDEVLEGIGGKEIYSFKDGFSGYHQISVAKEDRQNTTFVMEWGFF